MAGLPKSYIKKYGVSKRAWAEYRKAKRSGKGKKKVARKTAKRRTAAKPAAKPARRRRRAVAMSGVRLRRVATTGRDIGSKATATIMGTALGVAGAIGTAAIVNRLPITGNQKAVAQMGLGVAGAVMLPARMRKLRVAMVGASLAGALALVKSANLPVPMLAGSGMGVNFYPSMNGNGRIERRPVKTMGAIMHKGNMAGTGSKGYGAKFMTQANM